MALPTTNPKPIVFLGWGSLIWNPGDLPITGAWRLGGPSLPIEFSRISSNKRLTLVIDAVNGPELGTRFVQSSRQAVEEAVTDLQAREDMPTAARIGFVDRCTGRKAGRLPTILQRVEAWAERNAVDAVIWTDLPSNFHEKSGKRFTPETAAAYLQSLAGEQREKAIEYIRRAPPEIDTPARRLFISSGIV